MKGKITAVLIVSFLLLIGGMSTAGASDALDYREGNYLVHLLGDGDGTKTTFPFTTGNRLTETNTTIIPFLNAREIKPTDYTIDYTNQTITLIKAPDPGAELSIKYLITPTFEWAEGIAGKSSIGHALTEGDGTTRTFKVTSRYILNSSKNVSLTIDGYKLSSSDFKFDHHTLTVTISEKRQAPGKQAKIYFYFPTTSIAGTVTPEILPEQPEEQPEQPEPTPEVTPEPELDDSDAAEFKVPSGVNFPGTIKLNSNFTFTVTTTAELIKSGYYSYIMIKNTKGKLIKRVRINGGASATYSLSTLNLPAGGYYFYIKTVTQYGGFAASNPQFIAVRNASQQIGVFIEGSHQVYTQPPVNRNGSVLVPLRGIFEALGATVKWEASTQTITATKEGITIVLTIGSNTAYVNGKAVVLGAAAQLINGSTMVPIRFISEALGAIVEWDKTLQSVIIFQNNTEISTSVESERDSANEEIDEAEMNNTSPILQKISEGINKPTDIVFVIDVTGSMGEVINYVKETVSSFVDSVPSGSNFAILAYRDINYEDSYNPALEFFGFTNQKSVLKDQLIDIIPSGGMDIPESGLEAIEMALQQLSGSKNAQRIIFITDAPVHEKGSSQGMAGYFLEEVVKDLKTSKVTLDAIAPSSGIAYEQIIQLVESDNGTLYDINDASVLHLK